jgi:uncharacterized protein (DUF1330 family)
MPKGYWIARVDVHDADAYRLYIAANGPVFATFGGRFLARGVALENPEGGMRARNVVIEFPSAEAAQACYHSAAYQEARKLRLGAGTGDLVIMEGYEGPQPVLG